MEKEKLANFFDNFDFWFGLGYPQRPCTWWQKICNIPSRIASSITLRDIKDAIGCKMLKMAGKLCYWFEVHSRTSIFMSEMLKRMIEKQPIGHPIGITHEQWMQKLQDYVELMENISNGKDIGLNYGEISKDFGKYFLDLWD